MSEKVRFIILVCLVIASVGLFLAVNASSTNVLVQ
jgi:hypothetical protein